MTNAKKQQLKKIQQKITFSGSVNNSRGLCSVDVFYFLVEENNRGSSILQKIRNGISRRILKRKQ